MSRFALTACLVGAALVAFSGCGKPSMKARTASYKKTKDRIEVLATKNVRYKADIHKKLAEFDGEFKTLAAKGEQGADDLGALVRRMTAYEKQMAPSPSKKLATKALAGGAQCVDFNRATERELAVLKGVGPVLAKRIIGYRKAQRAQSTKMGKGLWNFADWRSVMAVPGVGPQICKLNLSTACFSNRRAAKCPVGAMGTARPPVLPTTGRRIVPKPRILKPANTTRISPTAVKALGSQGNKLNKLKKLKKLKAKSKKTKSGFGGK